MRKLTGMVLTATVIVSLAVCGDKAATETAAPAKTARMGETKIEETKKDETKARMRTEMPDVKQPIGPVFIFVPGKASANLDTKTRLVTKYLNPELRMDVVVDSRLGASGITAYTQYLAGEANNNNIEYTTASDLAITSIYSDCKLTAGDSVIAAGLDGAENGLFVDAKLGIGTLEELEAYAKDKTMKLTSAGAGNDSFLVSKVMMEGLGIISDSVNGDGSGDALVNMMNDSAEVCYYALNQASQYVEDGSIAPLAVYSEENYTGYADLGFAGIPALKSVRVDVFYSAITWFSLQTGTDQAAVKKLAATLQKAYNNPKFRTEFMRAGSAMLPDISTAMISKRVSDMITDCVVFAEKIGN